MQLRTQFPTNDSISFTKQEQRSKDSIISKFLITPFVPVIHDSIASRLEKMTTALMANDTCFVWPQMDTVFIIVIKTSLQFQML